MTDRPHVSLPAAVAVAESTIRINEATRTAKLVVTVKSTEAVVRETPPTGAPEERPHVLTRNKAFFGYEDGLRADGIVQRTIYRSVAGSKVGTFHGEQHVVDLTFDMTRNDHKAALAEVVVHGLKATLVLRVNGVAIESGVRTPDGEPTVRPVLVLEG